MALTCCTITLQARPIDVEKAKEIGGNFVRANFGETRQIHDLQLVYTGSTDRGEICFYAFNVGEEGFVIVSADDRFRPIVGYSDEGPFETENMSPELEFYLEKIIEARTSPNAIFFDNTAEEWQSVKDSGKLISRNGGKSATYICTTKWNQDSPYNYYAPEASSGPGGRCYAGCVATAMSQVMKQWDTPLQGTGSHSYYCPGYGRLEANFGETTYDWEHMTTTLNGNSTQEEIEAIATLMYHCAIAVDMGFSPTGSGANSWDVPRAIRQYFSYTNHANLKSRDMYSLLDWQDMLKESIDKYWPLYYSGFSSTAGHAFVCDGYDDSDLFHFNWGWGGSSDGWFVIDEIDYADWAQAIFSYVPTDVYDYMPMQPDNLEVIPSGDQDFAATLSWTNPTQNIHFEAIDYIDKIVVTRNGEIVFTQDSVSPGADMSYTDYYMPTMVNYAVYAVAHNAKGLPAKEDGVILGPVCIWNLEMTSSDEEGWGEGHISLVNSQGVEIAQITSLSASSSQNLIMPFGHIELYWNKPLQNIEQVSFDLKDADGRSVVSFDGASSNLANGLFFVVNNTCGEETNPYAPQNLTATPEEADVILQWDADEGDVNLYCIYRDHRLYAVSGTNNFTDLNAAYAFHTYQVTAINDIGESDPSNICCIQTGSDCEAPTNLRFEIANNKVKLSWDAPQAENLTGYFVYRRTPGEEFKRIKSLVNTTFSDNFNNHNCEFYEYAVAAFYSDSECTSAYANSQENPELCFVTVNKTIIPQNLTYVITGNSVTLNWDAAIMAETYNVYRDGVLIAQDLIETTFTDDSLSLLTYYYTVTGQTAFLESNPSNVAVVCLNTDIPESSVSPITIYPNPSSGLVYVEAEEVTHVCVYNLMGQEVKRINVQGHTSSIDLSGMPDGTYFIKVIAESSNSTRKIIKIK